MRMWCMSAARASEILDRELLVLTLGDEEPQVPLGRSTLEGTVVFSFVLVTDYEGLPVLPVFTSEAALLRWRPEGSRYVALQGSVLVGLLAKNDWDRIVVDTGSPDAFLIDRSEAVKLAE